MRPLVAWLSLLAALLVAAPSAASGLLLSREVLEDPSASLSFVDVAPRAFTPLPDTLSVGYSASAFWLRLRLRAPDGGGPVVLRAVQPYLDDLRLYVPDPAAPGGARVRVTGDRQPFDGRDRASPALGFVVDVPTPEATVYVRVQGQGAVVLTLEAMTPREADRADRQLGLLQLVFAGTMLALVLIGARELWSHRDLVTALFTVYQAIYLVYGLAVTGWLAALVPASHPEVADMALAVAQFATSFTFTLFSLALLRPYAPPRALLWGTGVFVAAPVVAFTLLTTGHVRLALEIGAVTVLLGRFHLVALAATARLEQVPRRRTVLFAYAISGAVVVAFFSPLLGARVVLHPLPVHLRDAVGVVANGALSGLLFLMLVEARALRRREREHAVRVELEVANRTIEIERESKARAEADARTDFLTGLVARRRFVELADREIASAKRYGRRLSLLMIDIDHFKRVNDSRGHSVGDVVLQGVARVLSSALREVDVVGRVGGEEIAVLLPEADRAGAAFTAERLRRAVADASFAPAEGPPLRVTVSIGVAELAGRPANLDMLLSEADAALYEAKSRGRNRVSVAA